MEQSFLLVSAITVFVSISSFDSLVVFPISIESSAVGFKICITTAVVKKYKSITKEKRKKHDKILLLAKAKWNTIKL